MKGIVLHGGKGTRLRPLTHTGPKQLIPIAGKAISEYVLEDMRDAGIREVAIILGNIAPERVREYYGDGSRLGLKLTYIMQGEPKGISHAIALCKDFIQDDKFVVSLGDNLLKGGIAYYVKEFEKSKFDALLLLTRVKDPEHFGVADFDDSGKLRGVVEKPKYAPSPYIVTGYYFLSNYIFKAISEIKPSKRGELEITDALQVLLDEKRSVTYRIVEGWWKDTGTVEDILDANRLVLDDKIQRSVMDGTLERGSRVQGMVHLEEGALVKSGAIRRGPCFIGAQTTIDGDCRIGPYASIGRGCSLQGVEISNSILMDNCRISRFEASISDSVIGKFTQIKGRTQKKASVRLVIGEESQIDF